LFLEKTRKSEKKECIKSLCSEDVEIIAIGCSKCLLSV